MLNFILTCKLKQKETPFVTSHRIENMYKYSTMAGFHSIHRIMINMR